MKPSKLLTIAGILGASLLPFSEAKAQNLELKVDNQDKQEQVKKIILM